MERSEVNRLDNAHVVERHMQTVTGQLPQSPAAEAGAAEGVHLVAVGPLDGPQHVGAVARARDRHQHIAGASEVFQLLDEDPLEALVVGPGQNVRGVVGQTQDPQSRLIVIVEILPTQRAFAQVLTEVRGAGSGAAVADDKDQPPSQPAFVHAVSQALQLVGVDAQQFLTNSFQKRLRAQHRSKHNDSPLGLFVGSSATRHREAW